MFRTRAQCTLAKEKREHKHKCEHKQEHAHKHENEQEHGTNTNTSTSTSTNTSPYGSSTNTNKNTNTSMNSGKSTSTSIKAHGKVCPCVPGTVSCYGNCSRVSFILFLKKKFPQVFDSRSESASRSVGCHVSSVPIYIYGT